jgi:hypothetical protein
MHAATDGSKIMFATAGARAGLLRPRREGHGQAALV